MNEQTVTTILDLSRVFESRAIPYFIGGSIASWIHGEKRSTRDVDVVVELQPHEVPELYTMLDPVFHVHLRDMNGQALYASSHIADRTRRSLFNMTHKQTGMVVTVFVSSSRHPFETGEMQRRRITRISENQSTYVASPEDTILAKLEWLQIVYSRTEKGQQWQDVVGILRVQETLDMVYLVRMSYTLGVSDLLTKAIDEVA